MTASRVHGVIQRKSIFIAPVRPVNHKSFSDDQLDGNKSPKSAVFAAVAVIPKNKEGIFGNRYGAEIAPWQFDSIRIAFSIVSVGVRIKFTVDV